MNQCYNQPIVAPIVVWIVDQTCTFQCLIPMGYQSKYDRRGRTSPSGYEPSEVMWDACGNGITIRAHITVVLRAMKGVGVGGTTW